MRSKVNKKALLKLARFLRKLPPERFNYSHWVGEDWGGAKDLSCGTTACAIGWATTFPELKLRLCKIPDNGEYGPRAYVRRQGQRVSDDYAKDSIRAVCLAFGVPSDAAWDLFVPEAESYHSPGKLSSKASAKQVAAHIERYVKGLP